VKVLITGGSGFIGTNAVEFALGAGHEVLNLDIAEPKQPRHRAYWRKTDLRDQSDVEEAVTAFEPTHSLHLGAQTGMEAPNLEYFSANTDGTAHLVAVLAKCASMQGLLVTSSLLVCRNGYLPKSDTDYCPPNFYGESKMRTEKIVRDASPLPFGWAIVRPTSVWGPWFEGPYWTFFRTVANGYYMHPGAATIVKPLTYVGNTVYAMFNILQAANGPAAGQTFYIADYPDRPVREWAELIQKETGGPKVRTAPIWLMRLIATAGDLLKMTRIWPEPPLTNFRLSNMLTGSHYPSEKTEAVVGSLPFSLEAGVRETVDWMRGQGDLGPRRGVSE